MRVVRGVQPALAVIGERPAALAETRLEAVREVLRDVRARGDAALFDLTERFDGVRLASLRVPPEAFAAPDALDEDLKGAVREAVGRIRAFYERQPGSGFLHAEADGLLGQLVRPLERVACYVPGGQAPLFSTLLMTAVPARVAGVREVLVATPPGPSGEVPPVVLLAALEAGVDEVYRVGGPAAIAALAYGTQSVPRADKIVGPGNALTMLAKRLVYGEVGIEALPGPTETLLIADEHADPEHVVADLLAQAEHVGAQPVLVTPSADLLRAVEAGLESQLERLPQPERARDSLAERGLAVLVATLQEALEVANAYAPEHLCLLVADPWALVPGVRHAGGLFLGAHSMEALGDYLAGPSHVMPTGGSARFSSALNLRDFQKVIPLVGLGAEALARLGPAAARMARAEGLEAHARAIESRLPQG